jgi:hypothetical protein
MSDRGKRRNNRRDKQKIKSDEKEKEKDKEKDNERERSRDKEKEKEKVKSYEDKKNNFSSKNENEKEDKKNKSEKILNNILLTNDKNDQSNLIILPLENSSKELNQYSSVHVNKQALLNLLKCPLCKGYYRTPYTINECMHTFCRSCIFKYFGYSNQREQCPVCNTKIGGRPMDSLIFDNYLDSLLNILFPKFEEIDKNNRNLLYKTFREAGKPLPGDEEEVKSAMPNIKVSIMPQNNKENKFSGVFLVPKNFDVFSMKKLISKKISEEEVEIESIVVKYKDNELLNNYSMDVVDSQYGFDQDKIVFYYYIKNKDKDKY